MNAKQYSFHNPNYLATTFVPAILRAQYANFRDRKMGDPLKEDHATLLWIDVCNFSPLCSRLMRDTVSGVEKITGILASHYDFVLDLVTEFGGQPLFFAGDGVMCAWPGDEKKAGESVQIAAACALKIINNRQTADDKEELLSLHIIISSGLWQMTELEGVSGNYLVSFFGQVFSDLAASSKNKAPNRVLITNTALSYLANEFPNERLDDATSILKDVSISVIIPGVSNPHLSEEAVLKLHSYIPRTLAFPLKVEHFKWIAEIRPVTILFVRLPNNGISDDENLRQLRESVALSRPLVQKYEGLLNQIWMDEKESNMLICFGPPPSANIDNPERSVRLGFEIHHLLKNSGIENSVGISSGTAYCGIIGNDRLRQYTVIGDVVNLSAHIAGIKRNEIFCDKATYSDSYKTVNYGAQVMAAVKGRKEPVTLFIPKSLIEDDRVKPVISISIGREKELGILLNAFHDTAAGKGNCIILEGDSGMGKTRLLEDFKTRISSENVLIVTGQSDFVSRNTPYTSLRAVISSIIRIGHQEAEIIQTTVYDSLLSRYGSKACLLNAVLNTAIPDSEEIRTLTGTQRVQVTHEFLLGILENETTQKPLVIIMDDARWVDESTWTLLEAVNNRLGNCLVILAFQITEGHADVQRLKDQGAETVLLKELVEEDIEKLICAKLGVSSISRDVTTVVQKISKGNPFFCIELAGSLMDHELLLFENNTCSLVKDAGMKEFSLPETVRGAIRRRIDRLGQGSQLSLKVGSVVGKRFAEKIICNIYPIANERHSVSSYLHEVEQYGFLNETTVDNLNGYLFNNAITVEVAYEMTLAEQRRQLHRESAEWYEKNFPGNLQPFYVRLANHWKEANEDDKAVAYYEKEATRLFRLGFVKEALNVGLEGVKRLGQDIPRDLPSIGQKIGDYMGSIGAMMEGKTINSLAQHQKLEDRQKEKIIKMLVLLGPFAYQSQQEELFALMSIICQYLTLKYGNGESAAEVYAMYAIIYKTLTGDSEGAFTWSTLSLEVDKGNGHMLRSRVIFIHCWFIGLWKLPLSSLIPLSYVGADAGFETGDITYACFNLSLTTVLKSVCGKPLSEVVQTAIDHYARNNQAVVNAAFHLIHEEQVAKAFQGLTKNYTSLTDDKYNEKKDIASIRETDLFNQIAYYLVSKLKLNAHFGNWEKAIEWGERSLPLLPAFANQPGHIELEQFYTMAALYMAVATTGEVSVNFWAKAGSGIDKINAWAKLCPPNFLHKVLMLEAIREGLTGNSVKAGQLFEQAAEKSMTAGYIQDQGLAFEHLVRMKKRQGSDYSVELESALEAYRQWGAHGKVQYLQEQFL